MSQTGDPCSQEIDQLKTRVDHINEEVNDVRQRIVDLETRHSKCLLETHVSTEQRPPSQPSPAEFVVHVLKAEQELPQLVAAPLVPPKPTAATVCPTVRTSVTAEFNGPADVEHHVEETPNLQTSSAVSGQITPVSSRVHITETTTETRNENGTTVSKLVRVTENVLSSSSTPFPPKEIYQNGDGPRAIRLIGLQKRPGDDHLVSTAYCARVSHMSSDPVIAFLQGLTVHQDNGQLVIARILDDSPLAKEGILHVGDSILEVNGAEVRTPEELQKQLKGAETVALKIVPSGLEVAPPINGAYMKCYFDYDPQKDDNIPSKEIGLTFKIGDILQIVAKDNPNWWQARKVNDWSKTGLVPSQTYEANRRAAVLAQIVKSPTTDQASTPVYEEVGRLTPYGRRVLVLLGASGVGRRTLKARLLQHDGDNFGTITPFTSRKKREGEIDGREYNFAPRDKLQQEIERGEFLEWGEFNGNFYGTKLESVRKVVRSGRLCVLDCSPQALKYLYNRQFMPYVVFLAPPPIDEFKQIHQIHPSRTKPKTDEDLVYTCEESARLEGTCKHYFDLVLVNRNAEVTFRRLYDALESLKNLHQWVPASWIDG